MVKNIIVGKFDINRIKSGDTVVCKNSDFFNHRYAFNWTNNHITYEGEVCRVFREHGGEIECRIEDIDFVVYDNDEEGK